MSTRIEQCPTKVHQILADGLALVNTAEARRLVDVERQVWTLVMALGCALVEQFLIVQAGRPRAAAYRHEGRELWLSGKPVTTMIGTLFGEVAFTRSFGVSKRRGKRDFPVDRELGIGGGFSLLVVARTARLCAQMAFACARETFKDIHGWCPSTRGVLRIVDAAGGQARAFLEQAPPPDDDGDVLVVQVDGGGAPMIAPSELLRRQHPQRRRKAETKRKHRKRRRQTRDKPRRTKGEKSKNSKVAFVGTIYSLKQTMWGKEGPIRKRTYATFESHEALCVWLRREANKRGARSKRLIFMGDGSEHIWRQQQKYFPEAETCVDWWHIVEKLWAAGECLHKEGSQELAAFINVHVRQLRHGDIDKLCDDLNRALARIPKTGPGNKGRRHRLHGIIQHLLQNKGRMPYRQLRQEGLDIGTGAIEGAVRNLVRVRLDGPGMRWSRGRAEFVLHLRCILINGQWSQFVEHLAAIGTLRLKPAPQPTQPHLAKAAA